MGQPAVAGHGDEIAGQTSVIDVLGEMAVDASQPGGVQPDLGGVHVDLQLSHVVSSRPAGGP
ncbi:MAG: hypothetical protein M3Y36_03020 [Actinomycetota bacterium]|nr:hypothetical protein [Actinomycetota bacterium]